MKVITPLWKLQEQALEYTEGKNVAALFMWMATGKTVTALAHLERWNSKKIIIFCPKAVGYVWIDQFKEHTDFTGTIINATSGTAKQRLTMLKSNPDVLVVNYEIVSSKQLWTHITKKMSFDTAILDESHRIKSPTGKRSKAIGKLKAKYRLLMTGTFQPNTWMDVFAQFRFLNRDIFGGKRNSSRMSDWMTFKHRYGIWGTETTRNGRTYPVFLGRRKDTEQEFADRIAKYAFIADKSKAHGLPPETLVIRETELEPDVRKSYDELEKDFVAYFKDAGIVDTPIALTKMLRCHQVVGGFAATDDGELRQVSTAKLDLLADVLEDLNEPVVIFCKFTAEIEAITKMLHHECSLLYKNVNQTGEWFAGRDNVLVVQIAKGAEGVDFSRARIAIFYSLSFNNAHWLQGRARIVRPNSLHPAVTTMVLQVPNTLDTYIYSALENKNADLAALVERINNAKI